MTFRALSALTSAGVVTLALAGCGTIDDPAATTTVTVTAQPSASESIPDTGPTSAEASLDLPEGVTAGTPAAAAWEALMSPVGEYAASASYQAVIDEFGEVEPYVTIRQGEERHIMALTRQLERMGVEVPDNPYLGEVAAPADLQAAAQAWADGEVENVALYDRLAAMAADDSRLTHVFGNLRYASQEEHLPAFEAAAAGDGTLTQAQMDELGMHSPGDR